MAQKKRGLGRGLDALIEARPDSSGTGQIMHVDVDLIEANPFQPRGEFDQEELASLAASILEHGVIQPIIVTQGEGAAPYRLIAGERRWRAARKAGLSEIPALVRESSPREMLEMALIENIQRADLNALEEAAAYRQLIEDFGLTHTELAERVGRNRSSISNTLRLIQCPEEVQQALLSGTISEGHARALLGLPGSVDQIAGLEIVISRELSVRQTERLVQEWNRRAADDELKDPEPAPRDPLIQDFQDRLQRTLGTRVELKKGRRGGKLIIHYYSDDELNQLGTRLLGDEEL